MVVFCGIVVVILLVLYRLNKFYKKYEEEAIKQCAKKIKKANGIQGNSSGCCFTLPLLLLLWRDCVQMLTKYIICDGKRGSEFEA